MALLPPRVIGPLSECSTRVRVQAQLTGATVTGCEQTTPAPVRGRCNQGVGNGPEDCDPGNSNQGDLTRSNDELGGTPGNPGRKGGNGK